MEDIRTVGVICATCGTFLKLGEVSPGPKGLPDRSTWLKPQELRVPLRCTSPTCRRPHLYTTEDLLLVASQNAA